VELYLEGADAAEAVVAVRLFEGWLGRPVGRVPVVRRGEEAARHLLRVAAGLESAILGDDQILGQARQAYREACEAGKAGRLLHRLFHAAFRTGRRARSETPLKEGTRSIAGAAVAEIARLLGDLSRRTVTVVGAGRSPVSRRGSSPSGRWAAS
jgi:glutamyl-tRNA reductase